MGRFFYVKNCERGPRQGPPPVVGSGATASLLSVPLFFASMLSTASLLLAAFLKVAFPILALIALIDLATMSRPRRVRLLRRQGMTWAAIAARFSVSPSTVRRWSLA